MKQQDTSAASAEAQARQGALFDSEVKRTDLSQFYTPPVEARRIIQWAELRRGVRILEPSAGQGAFVQACIEEHGAGFASWTLCDIDPNNCKILRERFPDATVINDDFTNLKSLPPHDIACQNPPYENDLDSEFVRRCLLDFGIPRVIALLRSDFLLGVGRFRNVWQHVTPSRIAFFRRRPKFGGSGSPMSDYAAFDLGLQAPPRKIGQRTNCEVEWW